MAAFCTLVPQRLRRYSCNCRTGRSPRSSKRDGMDLVGRSHQLRQSSQSKKPFGKAPRPDRALGILSSSRGQAPTPQATRFNHLPRNQPWNSKSKFPHSRDQGEGEGCISGDAQKVSYEKITAFLHAQTSGNSKGGRANRQHHALQDQRVNECRVEIERVKRDPNFAGASDERNNRPHTTHHDRTSPRVQRANGPIERLAALDERLPLWRVRQARDNKTKKTEHAQPLHKVKTGNADDTNECPDQSGANEISLSRYANKQYYTEQRKTGLGENAQRKVHEHAGRRDRQRRPIYRSQPRPDDVSANCGGGNECADRLTDPAHPKQLPQRQAIGFRKKNPPSNCVKKHGHREMVGYYCGNSPACGSEGSADLGRALPDEQDWEKCGP